MRTYVCLRMFGEKFVIKIIQNGFFSKLLECVGEQCVRSLDEVIDKLDGSGQPESLSNKRLNVLNSLRDLMVAAILFFDSTKTRDPTIAFGIQSTSSRGRLQMSC